MRFRAGRTAPAEARSAVTDAIPSWVPSDRVEDAALLTSELVTNSVRHAGLAEGAWVELDLSLTPERLRVEVRDDGHGFETFGHRMPDAEPEGGWGLHLIEEISDRWGIARMSPTQLWFELDTRNSRNDKRVFSDERS